MDNPNLFVNDGSFLLRFKQLQQEKENEGKREVGASLESSKPARVVSATKAPGTTGGKSHVYNKTSDTSKPLQAASGGKLAFSLKQKSKLVARPAKLGGDEEEEEETNFRMDMGSTPMKRQRLGQSDISKHSSRQFDIAPPSPSDPTVKNVADRLANFVAKHGRQLEHVTRQKNPGDTPFKFLFDGACADYQYYEYRLSEEEKALQQSGDSQKSQSGGSSIPASRSAPTSERSLKHASNYQIPTSALYEDVDDPRASVDSTSAGKSGADPVAMMEFYMKKAAQEERRRKPKQSKDEMPPPASLQAPAKRGHHMGDYIPLEELEKFLSSCNDVAAQKATREAAEKAKIQADNVGHKLLSKMGWKEGEGLGSSRSGISNPIMAGDVKTNNLGVGAHQPGEVTPDDDIYEQYKKRMMLGYRYRPNPLNNPRKAYY
ncbi:SURP and G-patch domain-containing protein 1-like protein isoform X1 [Syzygium oleosum]|uniref:SURP and G-patch domain-containing protein 1-like protein isoform X1 n=1 Tax=Syzygium oleosum TaxID=219896 RepID=UPI0011D1A317|nr:SURP and G-patch domain-containing protein 1-like protein isoform X1 [Syzygium oleosum]